MALHNVHWLGSRPPPPLISALRSTSRRPADPLTAPRAGELQRCILKLELELDKYSALPKQAAAVNCSIWETSVGEREAGDLIVGNWRQRVELCGGGALFHTHTGLVDGKLDNNASLQ